MGLWSASLMLPTVTVNMACHKLKNSPYGHQFSVKPLSPKYTHTQPIFLTHTDPLLTEKHTGKHTWIWRYHLDRWPATQTWPACPLVCSLPPSASSPPSPLNWNQFRSAGKPQMNMHSKQPPSPPPLLLPPPPHTHLQQAQQMPVTHWAVCGDYCLICGKNKFVSS